MVPRRSLSGAPLENRGAIRGHLGSKKCPKMAPKGRYFIKVKIELSMQRELDPEGYEGGQN